MDAEEIRWIKSSANELNNLLQVITESSQFLEKACRPDEEKRKYFEMLRDGVERAAQSARGMLKRAGELTPASGTEKIFDAAKIAPCATPPLEQKQKPVAKPAAAPPKADDFMDSKIANPRGPKELIMVVDDEAFVALLAQRTLADAGYRVITARDGFECLDLYKKLKEKIALIILDFDMPVMDGGEVFDQLRSINPRVCVVLSSGFTEQSKLRTLLAQGLRGFIPKPYNQQKLLMQVHATLESLKS